MTFDTLPLAPPARSLSRPVRLLAGVVGGLFLAFFLELGVRHPAEGWLGAIGCGVPMIWLIQGARTGRSQNWSSVVWYAVWYAIFASGWLIALELERPAPGDGLSGQVALGVFLGSIVLVGGAASLARRTGAPRA